MKTTLVGLLVMLQAFLWAPRAYAGAGEDALLRFFNETRTLEARFDQAVFGEDGERLQQGSGQVALMRPGRLRWEYLAPDPQLILVDGERLWIYDQELEQATVKPVKEALATAPIMLLTEAGDLNDQFVVEERGEKYGLQWVGLRPKVEDSEFTLIHFGLKNSSVQQMVMFDQFGQRTVIRFRDLRINKDLPSKTFEFKPPPGVDVIGEGAF